MERSARLDELMRDTRRMRTASLAPGARSGGGAGAEPARAATRKDAPASRAPAAAAARAPTTSRAADLIQGIKRLRAESLTGVAERGHASSGGGTAAAADALLAARGLVKKSRSAEDALAQAGATHLFAGLGVAERGGAVAAASEAAARAYHGSKFNCYARYITRAGKGMPPLPLTRTKINAYFSFYVLDCGHKSSSLTGILSSLRNFTLASRARDWALSASDELLLERDITTLTRCAPATRRAARRLDTDELIKAATLAASDDTPHGRQLLAVFTLLVGFQSRGVEILDGGLQYGDLELAPVGVLAAAVLDKTRQTVLRPRPKAAIHVSAAHAVLCASRALRRHLELDSGWVPAWSSDPARRAWPVFGTLKRCGATGAYRVSATALPIRTAMAAIKALLVRAGVSDLDNLDAHFGRHAGTNFHQLELGLGGDLTEGLGGWAPHTVRGRFYMDLSAGEIGRVGARDWAAANPGTARCCS